MSTLSIRIPDEMVSRLNQVCSYYHRSKNYITAQALKSYIENMLEDIEDSMDEDILLRYNDPKKVLLNSEEATEYLKANCKRQTCTKLFRTRKLLLTYGIYLILWEMMLK